MCYGMNCQYELHNGECGKPYRFSCPAEDYTRDDYTDAVDDAEWDKEERAEFARARRCNEK